MSGVGWDERQKDDWLASNGRWYPSSKYPRGWSMSALPPAPDHLSGSIHNTMRGVRSRIGAAAESMSTAAGSGGVTREDVETPQPARRTPTQSSFMASPTSTSSPASSGPAQATVTAHRTYEGRLPAPPDSGPRPAIGAPPAPQPPPPERPPAPGRFTDDDERQRAGLPAMPSSPTPPSAGDMIVGGDLGSLFGTARQKIEARIEEAIEQVEGR